MRRHLLVFSVVGLALAGTANAAVQQGDVELGLLGGWLSGDGGSGGVDYDAWFLSGRLGRFVTDNIKISGIVAAMHQEEQWSAGEATPAFAGELERKSEVLALGAQVAYHFGTTRRWVPYVGAQLLWANAEVEEDYPLEDVFDWSRDEDGFLYGPLVGFRLELSGNSDFFVEYQYHLWGGDIDDLIDDGHGLFLGVIYQFD